MKSITKIMSLFTVICVLAILFVGCSAEPPVAGEESGGVEQSDFYPVTITDHLGREVIIEDSPEKLVSGYYVSSSMLIALGLEDKVVGIEAKADTRPIYSLAAPQFLELSNVGTAKEFNLEGCIALTPDLVILPVSLREQTVGLEEVGIDVIYVNPESTELLQEALMMVATATQTHDRASEIINYSNEALIELSEKLRDIEPVTVYLGGNSDFLSTAGAKMYQNTMITNAHGVNVALDIEDTYWATVSYEQILAYNPDYIILAAAADYTTSDVLGDANLANISAVQNEKVFALPSDIEAWDSPVPSAFLGSLYVASVLYPEQYPTSEYEATVEEFYNLYYNF